MSRPRLIPSLVKGYTEVHMVTDTSTYVVIHGMLTSKKSAVDYVADIVYGNPRVEAIQVGSHFVAVCEFATAQKHAAAATFERMGSFPHGASLMLDRITALREFGTWIYHYAPGTVVGDDGGWSAS